MGRNMSNYIHNFFSILVFGIFFFINRVQAADFVMPQNSLEEMISNATLNPSDNDKLNSLIQAMFHQERFNATQQISLKKLLHSKF